MPGPLRNTRIRNQMDRRCPDAPRRCSNCLQPGHTAPNCPVLYLQSEHRFAAIFQGTGVDLDVRRCDRRFFQPLIDLDERVAQYIDAAGFYGIRRAGYLTVDHDLINALVERWRQETHNFHLPVMGEATVTLQDVEVLWGLRVDVLPVTLVHRRRNLAERKQLIYDILGYWPEDNMLNHDRLKITSISQRLSTPLPANASDVMVRQYARMYILILLGGLLFADSGQNLVSLNWLAYVRDLDAMRQYSWGAATLACLYSQMCHASRVSAITTGGPFLLLQFWAWERIPVIRPDVLPFSEMGDFPRGGRWAAKRTGIDPSSQSSIHYREQLALLRMDQFIWMPYTDDILARLPDYCKRGERIWRARLPLIFWYIIEFHCPDRVMRQFGMRQEVPEPVDTNRGGLHQLDLSGYPGRNWADFHKGWIGYWNARATAEVPGVPTTTFRPSNAYLEWYHNHTILYITPPIQQHTQHGQMLHGVSGQFEYLVSYLSP
ncbi:unnamed protein product [Coffea canephora]|uniref:CCHC-type domain-containing protein n=1 Tax=Coffea canephora TaxID=49390 RepID=A0A068UVK3_COFCA|nr:unnamed protein product [Coffea canephora]